MSRRVRFYEVRSEAGQQLAEITDLERHFFDVVASLPADAREHWQSDRGLRVRGQVYRPDLGATARVPLLIIDRVHREPPFRYVRAGSYRDHAFEDPETEFAEPKFLAFFERNVVATFTAGLRMAVAEAAMSTWRVARGLAPVRFVPVTDVDRLGHLAEAEYVDRLEVRLPSEVARRIYRQRRTSIAEFFRSQSNREGYVTVQLAVDTTADPTAGQELRDELQFLVEDDEVYTSIVSAPGTVVDATYHSSDSRRPRSQNFLGQELAMSVTVEIAEPERGPQNSIASEALFRAHERKREALHRVLGEG